VEQKSFPLIILWAHATWGQPPPAVRGSAARRFVSLNRVELSLEWTADGSRLFLAAKRPKNVAHGASRGSKPGYKLAPTGRKRYLARQRVAHTSAVSPAPSGLGYFLNVTHGLRRGLHSLRRFAAPLLGSLRTLLIFNRAGRRCFVQRNGCIFTAHQGKMHIERNSKRLTRRCTPFLPTVQKCGPIVCVG
jgi:hypothetical protein